MSAVSAAAMLMSSASAPSSLLTGLLGFWSFDGDSTDASGAGNNGTNTGVSYVAGKIGQGATGTPGWNVNVGSSLALKPYNAISVAAWVRWVGFQANGRTLADFHQSQSSDRWLFFEPSGDGDVEWLIANYPQGFVGGVGAPIGPYIETLCSFGVLVTGTWYSLIGTYDGRYLKTYTNGSLVNTADAGSAAFPNMLIAANADITFGGQTAQGPAGNSHNGVLDAVGIWDRALTATEAALFHNGGTGRQYPF